MTVKYEVVGAGPDKASRSDFAKPGDLKGKLVFKPIDQSADFRDTAGAGVQSVALTLKSDGKAEGFEGLKIKLTSQGSLGTDVVKTQILDGDLAPVLGQPGKDGTLRGSKKDDALLGLDGDERLLGLKGRDLLDGGAGNDRLDGGKQNDTLTGGDDADRFIFSGKAGNDVITDFSEADTIDFTAYSGLSFRKLALSREGPDVSVDFGRGTVLLEDTRLKSLDANDFDFA